MKKDNVIYIQDALNAIDWILDDYICGISQGEFEQNHEKIDAVIRQIAIIGEALNKLDADFLKSHPEIPAKDAIAMRNVLVHDYDMVDTDELWKTINQDLVSLRKVLTGIININHKQDN
ncbi:MAG: hypothetical protein ACD_22C00171G0011 [uncultured bacterium]|nr:MAG: hypothetical protein ACD_22C00171G0011 [uncultured bacterium]